MVMTALLSFCAGATIASAVILIGKSSTNINMLGSNFRVKAKGTEIAEISVTGTGKIVIMYLWGKYKGKAQIFDYPKIIEKYYKSHNVIATEPAPKLLGRDIPKNVTSIFKNGSPRPPEPPKGPTGPKAS